MSADEYREFEHRWRAMYRKLPRRELPSATRAGAFLMLAVWTRLPKHEAVEVFPEDFDTWQMPIGAWRVLAEWEKQRMKIGACMIPDAAYFCAVEIVRTRPMFRRVGLDNINQHVRHYATRIAMDVTWQRLRDCPIRREARWIYRPAKLRVFRGYGENYVA